jgi:SnoaL-like domain
MHARPATPDQLVARAQIYDVLMQYMRGVDRRNMELVRAAYHPDARQTNPYLAPGEWGSVEDLITLMNQNAVYIPMSMHVLANIVFEFAAEDVAIVESYLMAYQTHRDTEGGEGFRQTGSRYLDRFERRDGNWKIAKRVLPLNFIRPLAPPGDQILFTNPVLSTRDDEDPLWSLRAEAGLD